ASFSRATCQVPSTRPRAAAFTRAAPTPSSAAAPRSQPCARRPAVTLPPAICTICPRRRTRSPPRREAFGPRETRGAPTRGAPRRSCKFADIGAPGSLRPPGSQHLAAGQSLLWRRARLKGYPCALLPMSRKPPSMPDLEFGWFMPTRGDTDDYNVPLKVSAGLEMFDRVAMAAETAGFECMLIHVGHQCWDAWMTGAMMTRKTSSMRMLIAARPSYINPVLLAKMIATFDQLTQGRISVNLIAGQSEIENVAEG